MVGFRSFGDLARQSIAGGKPLFTSYAQASVAAAQASYASQTLTPLSRRDINQNVVASRNSSALSSFRRGFTTLQSYGDHGHGQLHQLHRLETDLNASDVHQLHYQYPQQIPWAKDIDAQNALAAELQVSVLDESAEAALSDRQSRAPRLTRSFSVDTISAHVPETPKIPVIDTSAATTDSIAPARSSDVSPIAPSPFNSTFSGETNLTSPVGPSHPLVEKIFDLHEVGNHAQVVSTYQDAASDATVPISQEAFEVVIDSATTLFDPQASSTYMSDVMDIYDEMLVRNVNATDKINVSVLKFLIARGQYVNSTTKSLELERDRYADLFQDSQESVESVSQEAPVERAISVMHQVSPRSSLLRPAHMSNLLLQCYELDRLPDMIDTYEWMERAGMTSPAAVAAMIRAFARDKDMHSAVICYEQYDKVFKSRSRQDEQVYDALIEGYFLAGEHDKAAKFFESLAHVNKVASTTSGTNHILTMVAGYTKSGMYQEAHEWLRKFAERGTFYADAWAALCEAAAKDGKLSIAESVVMRFERIVEKDDKSAVARRNLERVMTALLDAQLEAGELEGARQSLASVLQSGGQLDMWLARKYAVSFLEMESPASAKTGYQALFLAASTFLESDLAKSSHPSSVAQEYLRSVIEDVGYLAESKDLLSPAFAMDALVVGQQLDNNYARKFVGLMLNRLDTSSLDRLSMHDLNIILANQVDQMQTAGVTIEDFKRFDHIFSLIMAKHFAITTKTSENIQLLIPLLSQHSDLLPSWNLYHATQEAANMAPISPLVLEPSPVAALPPTLDPTDIVAAEIDPYESSLNMAASIGMMNDLERDVSIDTVLIRNRNVRRAGRHVTYQCAARMITAAAKAEKPYYIDEILRGAETDMPFIVGAPGMEGMRKQWAHILDAAIAANLQLGNRAFADQLHAELLNKIGSAPSANTYGMFIVNLKSSGSFDEASEAVRIFEQSRSEGVYPTPFLFNALIAKLAKARRVDDALHYFGELRAMGLRPTSVTYGTLVNALCRVGDDKFAESLFEEMEGTPNYKPRAAPYNSLIQHFVGAKRDRTKALAYYERMLSQGIAPTSHTYKLLIDAYASGDAPDIAQAEGVLSLMKSANVPIESQHAAALIHAKGCVLHDLQGALDIFDSALQSGIIKVGELAIRTNIKADATLFQAIFEALVANHKVSGTASILTTMRQKRVRMTAYIANTLIHGWAMEKNIAACELVYNQLSSVERPGAAKREPSTYEAMTRAYLAVEDRDSATNVVNEMASRRYPPAVLGRVVDLLRGGGAYDIVSGAATPAPQHARLNLNQPQ